MVASLAAAAPLVAAALVQAHTLLTPPHESGYLLYARSGFCAPARINVGADGSSGKSAHRARRFFQPEHSPKATMPPELGQTAEWLTPSKGMP